MATKKKPAVVKFWLHTELIPELQFLGVLSQAADLFAHTLTAEEMARVVSWLHAKYKDSP